MYEQLLLKIVKIWNTHCIDCRIYAYCMGGGGGIVWKLECILFSDFLLGIHKIVGNGIFPLDVDVQSCEGYK